jgi:hypothetical protein
MAGTTKAETCDLKLAKIAQHIPKYTQIDDILGE